MVCEAEEAEAFCKTLNAHFAEDGISFHAPHPQRWYLRVAETGEVTFPAMSIAAWGDARDLMPQGRDAVRWRALGNEIQMLLHGHPLNQRRAESGQPPVSSLWLWGGGRQETARTQFEVAGGDEPLGSFARAAGLHRFDSLSSMLVSDARRGVWLEAGLLAPLRHHDLYRWRELLLVMQRELLEVAWQALGDGKLHRLTLEVPAVTGLHRFELKPADRWKVWRRSQPLSAHSV